MDRRDVPPHPADPGSHPRPDDLPAVALDVRLRDRPHQQDSGGWAASVYVPHRAAVVGQFAADSARYRVHGGVVGIRLPHHVLPGRTRVDPPRIVRGCAHRRRERMARFLARHAAPPAPCHADPGGAALWLGDGRDRRISDHGRFQPCSADLYLDCVYVGPGLPPGRLVPGLCGGNWLDRGGSDAGRRGLLVLRVPKSGLARLGDAAMSLAQPISSTGLRTASPETVHRGGPRPGTILKHGILIFFCLVVLLPLAWVLLLSIKSIPDAYTGTFWPEHFDFSHYGYVFSAIPTLVQNMLNSIVVTLSTVILTSIC